MPIVSANNKVENFFSTLVAIGTVITSQLSATFTRAAELRNDQPIPGLADHRFPERLPAPFTTLDDSLAIINQSELVPIKGALASGAVDQTTLYIEDNGPKGRKHRSYTRTWDNNLRIDKVTNAPPGFFKPNINEYDYWVEADANHDHSVTLNELLRFKSIAPLSEVGNKVSLLADEMANAKSKDDALKAVTRLFQSDSIQGLICFLNAYRALIYAQPSWIPDINTAVKPLITEKNARILFDLASYYCDNEWHRSVTFQGDEDRATEVLATLFVSNKEGFSGPLERALALPAETERRSFKPERTLKLPFFIVRQSGDPKYISTLLSHIKGSIGLGRQYAFDALSTFKGDEAAAAMISLIDAQASLEEGKSLSEAEIIGTQEFVRALLRTGSKLVGPALVRCLDFRLGKQEVIEALGKTKEQSAIPILVTYLGDRNLGVPAAFALGAIDGERFSNPDFRKGFPLPYENVEPLIALRLRQAGSEGATTDVKERVRVANASHDQRVARELDLKRAFSTTVCTLTTNIPIEWRPSTGADGPFITRLGYGDVTGVITGLPTNTPSYLYLSIYTDKLYPQGGTNVINGTPFSINGTWSINGSISLVLGTEKLDIREFTCPYTIVRDHIKFGKVEVRELLPHHSW